MPLKNSTENLNAAFPMNLYASTIKVILAD
jgi:hypothetical protein